MIEIYSSDDWGPKIFIHKNLLEERSSYFQKLIQDGKDSTHGRLSVYLHDLSYEACEMLAEWLYGQPLRVKIYYEPYDSHPLAELYDLACMAEKQGGTRDEEFVNACLDAIEQALTERSEIEFNASRAYSWKMRMTPGELSYWNGWSTVNVLRMEGPWVGLESTATPTSVTTQRS